MTKSLRREQQASRPLHLKISLAMLYLVKSGITSGGIKVVACTWVNSLLIVSAVLGKVCNMHRNMNDSVKICATHTS